MVLDSNILQDAQIAWPRTMLPEQVVDTRAEHTRYRTLFMELAHSRPIQSEVPSERAAAAVHQYADWYRRFISRYAQDLKQAKRDDLEGLRYASDMGAPLLDALSERLRINSAEDADTVEQVLAGYRLIAELVEDLDGREVLVIELAEDVQDQLTGLGLAISAEFSRPKIQHIFVKTLNAAFLDRKGTNEITIVPPIRKHRALAA